MSCAVVRTTMYDDDEKDDYRRFSHNPTDGCLTPIHFQASANANCLNLCSSSSLVLNRITIATTAISSVAVAVAKGKLQWFNLVGSLEEIFFKEDDYILL